VDSIGCQWNTVASSSYDQLQKANDSKLAKFHNSKNQKKHLSQLHGMLANIEKKQHHSTLQISYTFAIVVWNDS
jgi:hypothetical protein